MSSNRYQIVKKSRKFQMNPESSGEQVVSSMKVQTFGSTRTGGADNFAISSQGASASGKREMNLVSSGNSGDGILFSGRGAISSQGASASGKREMNLVSSGNSGDGILFSGRGTASGASKMQLSSSAQGFGFSSNTHGSRGSHNSRTENTNTQQITKTTRTYNRFGSSSSNGGEGGAGMIQTTTETRTEKRFGRGSQNSRDGSRDNGSTGRGAGLQMSTNGRSIQINQKK